MADKPKRKPKQKNKTTSTAASSGFSLEAVLGLVMLLAVAGAIYYSVADTNSPATNPSSPPPTATSALADLTPFDRGQAYLGRGRYLDAAAAFTAELELAPNNADARFWRAHSYRLAGDLQTAQADYTRLLDDHPTYGGAAWAGLAETHYALYLSTQSPIYLADARTAIEEALDTLDTNATDWHYRLAGDIYHGLGRPTDALRYYEQVAAPSPQLEDRIATLR